MAGILDQLKIVGDQQDRDARQERHGPADPAEDEGHELGLVLP